MIDEACLQEEMMLSREEKYLLEEIKQLRNVLEEEEDIYKD
jgi:hypothetical protein